MKAWQRGMNGAPPIKNEGLRNVTFLLERFQRPFGISEESAYANVASMVMSALKSLDTGQFALASCTAASNFSLLMPGTLAFNVS